MKGKLTQQDLTDYALNELSPNERLYVESLLAVSEEYRNDIYEMIDAALMLEEGFEIEEEKMPALLTDGQRQRVLEVELPNRFFQRAAVLLSAAAAIALALFNHDILLPKGATSMGQVATLEGAISDEDDLATKLANFRQLAEDPGFKKWFSAQPVNSQGYSAATQSSWGFAPRVSFDFK